MISLFQLSFVLSVRAEGGDPNYLFDECWGLRADNADEIAKCQRVFNKSVDIASRQVPPAHIIDDSHHQDYMPDNVQLAQLDPSNDGNMLDILYFGPQDQAQHPEIDDWTFFTLQSQSIPAIKEAIKTLHFDTKIREYDANTVYTPEQADKMISARIAALLGMPAGEYQFSTGKTVQKQFDVSDGVGWNPETQQAIIDNYDNDGFFRPCFNSFDIHSSECHYVPEGSDSYDWVQQWAKKSYTGPGQVTADGTPFTGRGWTFDWQKYWHCDRERWNHCETGSQRDEIGLSEFVLPPHASSVQWTETQTPLQFICEICKDDPDSCSTDRGVRHTFAYWARGEFDNVGCGWSSSTTQNQESPAESESSQGSEVQTSDDAQQQNQNDDSQPQSESSQQDEVPSSDDAQQQNQNDDSQPPSENSQQDEVPTSDDAQQQNQNDDSQPESESFQQDGVPTSDDAQQQNEDSQPDSENQVPSEENQNSHHEQDIHI